MAKPDDPTLSVGPAQVDPQDRLIDPVRRRYQAAAWRTIALAAWGATTNALERIDEESRRRTKTQASLPSEEAVLFLLFGLPRSDKLPCAVWSAGG
jgi:hypothetical protein